MVRMTESKKQKWLLSRLLIPAGILPPVVKYDDLKFNEENRAQVGNSGFEYYYLLEQNPMLVTKGPIKNKIFVLHAPWPEFNHSTTMNPIVGKIVEKIIFGKNKLPTDFKKMCQKSFTMAKILGARSVTLHIRFFDHSRLAEQLEFLSRTEKEFNIRANIEHDGTDIFLNLKRGAKYLKINGSIDWMLDPRKMLKVIDQFSPNKNFTICFDTAPHISTGMPLMENLEATYDRISHVHLASTLKGQDLPTDLNLPIFTEIVKFLFDKHYQGYITVESNGAVGPEEERIAKIYAASSIAGLSILKKKTITNAQKHIYNSCQYLLENFC